MLILSQGCSTPVSEQMKVTLLKIHKILNLDGVKSSAWLWGNMCSHAKAHKFIYNHQIWISWSALGKRDS